MALQAVPIERFAGLDLRAAPGANTAIDMLNVTVEAGGEAFRTRDGCASFVGLGDGPILHFATYGGDVATRLMITAFSPGSVAAHDGATNLIASGSLPGATLNNVSSQAIGTATGSYLYMATGSGYARFDGTTWTNPALPAGGKLLGVSPNDNRLVVANTSSSLNRVLFSDPGAPETFTANNFVDLDPGDGEPIVAVASWHDELFVFKQTKFFAFYGTSPNVDGSPIFNFRAVRTGIGCSHYNAVAVGPDGVYFLDRRGIFHTAGGPPNLISDAIDPFFRNQSHPYFANGATYAPSQGGQGQMLTFAQGRLYCLLGAVVGGSGVVRPFVWDKASNTWSLWDVTMAGGFRVNAFGEARTVGSQEGRVELVGGINNVVYRFSPTMSSDNGQAINWNYRAAFTDLGAPTEKTVRGTIIDGSSLSGSVSWQWSREWGALQPARTVALGSSLTQGRDWHATRGRLLSWQASGTSPAQIQRVEPLLRGSRPAGIKTAA